MNATLRSTLCAAVLVALAIPSGCIESRPHRGRHHAAQAEAAAVVVRTDPASVDGSLDRLVGGDRVRVDYDADDAMTGAAAPLVTIVEFSDFECPFCGRLADAMSGVLARYPDDVRLVFKQMPLAMHAHAEPAARAAVAAGAQGKFWEMHDRLFADRSKLGDADLLAHADAIGLDRAAFTAALAAPATQARVREQMQEAGVLEVSSTPTFFVNGRKFSGAKDPEAIAQIVDEEIVAARALLAAGAKREELYAHFMHAAKPGAGTPPPVADPTHKRGEASAQANYAVPVGADRPTVGPADAPVTIITYVDYGKPEGETAFPTLRALKQKHPEVRFAFRFLTSSRDAAAAARSLIAAGRQDPDKMWALHERFAAAGTSIVGAPLRRHAREVELDLERFDRDAEDAALAAMLEEDRAVIETVRGTAPPPFFLVNGRFATHDATAEQLEALIAEEAAKAVAFAKAEGAAGADLYEAMRKSWRGYRIIEGVTKAPRMGGAAAPPAADGGAAAAAAIGAPVLGDPTKAKVTIVACTDFDCPACARGAKVLQTLRERYGDQLAIEFRHNAPGGRHSGDVAHLAAIAAARQDKFWALHDLLYANKSARSEAALAKLAAQAELDLEAWNLARTDEALRARIEEDTAACAAQGLAALPSYAVAGTTLQGAQPIDRFTKLIDAALTK